MGNYLTVFSEINKGLSRVVEAKEILGFNGGQSKQDFMEVTGALTSLMKEVKENKKLDVQHTLIKGQIEKVAHNFHLQKTFLENTFAERRAVIQKQFDVIDFAMKNNDNEMLLNALASVSQVVTSSPLKDFQAFKNILDNDDETLYLDF